MAYVTTVCRRCRYDNDPQAIACAKCCAPLAVSRPASYDNAPQFWVGPLAALALVLVLVVFAVTRPISQQAPVEEETPPLAFTSSVEPRPSSAPEYELVWEMPEGSPNPRMVARRRQEMFKDRLAAIEARDKAENQAAGNFGAGPQNRPSANSPGYSQWKRKVIGDIARQIRATTDSGDLNGIRYVIGALSRDPSDTNFNARLNHLDQAAAAKLGIGAANAGMPQRQKNYNSENNIRLALR